jgi:hypothetical protein
LVQKFSREKKAYNALATPVLLYGSEIWTVRQKDKKTTDIGMKFLEELKVEKVDEKLRRYKIKLATTCKKNE